jgi:hypothetical protein
MDDFIEKNEKILSKKVDPLEPLLPFLRSFETPVKKNSKTISNNRMLLLATKNRKSTTFEKRTYSLENRTLFLPNK